MQADYLDTMVGTTVDNMALVFSSWAHTLFDTSASHSFITVLFVSILSLEYELLESTISVEDPLGQNCEL